MTTPDPTAAFRVQLWNAVADACDEGPGTELDGDIDNIVAAMEPVIRQIVAAELRNLTDLLRRPQVWADPMGAWSAGEADAAREMKAYLLRLVSMRAGELDPAAALPVQTADTAGGGTS